MVEIILMYNLVIHRVHNIEVIAQYNGVKIPEFPPLNF
jgi:hypothetical protein